MQAMDKDSQSASRSDQPVVQALRYHGKLTLRQLVEFTGFSHAAVTASVSMLRNREIVAAEGQHRSEGLGRPSTLWRLRPEAAYFVGIDVGAATTRVLIIDLAGQPVHALSEPTAALIARASAGPSVVRELAALVHRVLDSCPLPNLRPVATGVAVSGLVDTERGVCLFCANIPGWQDLPLAADLSALLDMPVVVDDSARAQAIAEHRVGKARGLQDFLYVNIGVGIGAAMFMDGRPYRGPGGLGGELGHITVDERGPRCGCGNLGCAEAVVGARAIVRRAVESLASHTYPSLLVPDQRGDGASPGHELTVHSLAEAAAKGDPLAFRVLNEAGEHLGVAVAAALNLLGSPLVVLGGGVARSGEPFIGAVRRTVMLRALPPLARQVQIEASQLDGIAGAQGMAMSTIEAYLRDLV
ncbi:MAG: transcriptional repressor [Chloroflexi bacterium]|jgi:predicted NBD/HSP70 family sugar kinase|nr:transcriptional repressor [Chloroflexota bacterium]